MCQVSCVVEQERIRCRRRNNLGSDEFWCVSSPFCCESQVTKCRRCMEEYTIQPTDKQHPSELAYTHSLATFSEIFRVLLATGWQHAFPAAYYWTSSTNKTSRVLGFLSRWAKLWYTWWNESGKHTSRGLLNRRGCAFGIRLMQNERNPFLSCLPLRKIVGFLGRRTLLCQELQGTRAADSP